MTDNKDIPNELIDALLANYEKPEDMLGKNGILEQLTKRVVERALQAEMTHHLGHEKHGKVANASGKVANASGKVDLWTSSTPFSILMRNSLKYVGWKERKAVTADLKEIYTSSTTELAESALEDLENKWNSRYPLIAKSWRANWQRVTPFFAYPPEIRKVIYTTNAIESLNMSLRKVIKTKRAFPHDEAVFKIFWLALRSISAKWTLPVRNWKEALNRFAMQFEDRFPAQNVLVTIVFRKVGNIPTSAGARLKETALHMRRLQHLLTNALPLFPGFLHCRPL